MVEFPQDLDGVSAYSSHEIEELDDIDSAFTALTFRNPALKPCGIFAVEQPELHVHPAVQCGLGDVFIEAAKATNRLMLIETHSEHLLLRLLRRVRESEEATASGPDLSLKPDDLSIVYVLPIQDGVELTPLVIDESGDFETEWPEGFFGERFDELFGGNSPCW